MHKRSVKKRKASSGNLVRAEELLAQSSGRVTPARCKVLAILLNAEQALSHQEVDERLGKNITMDRVTLYRVLEWLVSAGLAHRVCGDDRVWRFGFARQDAHHQHAHFNCSSCGQVFCLNEVSTTIAVSLPAGFQSREVDLTIKGVCEHCH